jgi:hypothetical protein
MHPLREISPLYFQPQNVALRCRADSEGSVGLLLQIHTLDNIPVCTDHIHFIGEFKTFILAYFQIVRKLYARALVTFNTTIIALNNFCFILQFLTRNLTTSSVVLLSVILKQLNALQGNRSVLYRIQLPVILLHSLV